MSLPRRPALPPVPQTVRRRQWLFRKVTAPYNASQGTLQQMFRRRAGTEAK